MAPATRSGVRAAQDKVWDTLNSLASWLFFVNLWEILGNSSAWVKSGYLYGKALESSCVGPQFWWAGVSENHQDRASSVSQFNGNSDITAAWVSKPGAGKAQLRNNKFHHFCLWESCSFSTPPKARQFSSFSRVYGTFWAAAPKLKLSVSESASSAWAWLL